MKKVYLIFFFLFFLPFSVKAIDADTAADKMNDYMESAIKNNSWIVEDNKDKSTFNIKIKVGNTKDSDFKEVLDQMTYAGAFWVKKYYKATAMLIDCPNKQCDNNHFNYYVLFDLKKVDDNGDVFLEADRIDKRNYDGILNAEKIQYSLSTTPKGWFKETKKKDGTTSLKTIEKDDSAVDKTVGREANPQIIKTSGTIKFPSKDDSFWDGAGDYPCYYFRFDFSSESSKTLARYQIDPAEDAQRQIFWGNDGFYRLAENLVQDVEDPGLFQVSKNNYYGICATTDSDYGKTFTFTYKDTEQITVGNHIQQESADRQNGENSSVLTTDKQLLEKYKDVRDFEKKSIKIKEGCSVLGNETLEVLKTILNYLRIAAVALLLVLGSLDFAGAVMSDKEDAMKSAGSKFKNRLIACVVVFLIPSLVNVALFVVNKSESTCNLFGGEMEKTVEFSNGNVVSSPSNSGSTPSASVKPVDPPITSSAPSPSSTPSVKPSNSPTPTVSSKPSPTPTISSSPSPTPSASSKPSTNKKKEYKILFIGNSFTERNNMPNLFKKLVEGTGKKVTVSSVTKNGHQLIKFADFSTTEGKKVEKALKKKWDYVVLQDASRSFLEKDPTTLKAVQKLNKYIKKSGAKTILYMTWPFKNTHEIYSDSTYKIRNPEKFYEKVKDGYNNVAKKTGATVAPVGTSFMRLINQNSKINLYANDKYHPSKYGSFLAACTIYDTIYQERSSKSSYNGGLSSKYAKTLKSTADGVCF